jgi:outer membrane protein
MNRSNDAAGAQVDKPAILLHKPRLSGAVSWSVAAIVLIALGLSLYVLSEKPDIRFVRTSKLIAAYQGTKEAEARYNGKQGQWKAEVDTLQADFTHTLNSFNAEYASLSSKERTERERLLRLQDKNVQRHTADMAKRAEEERRRMMEGVLNQINSRVQEYGRLHGIDAILGTTSDGSVLYGAAAIDVTNDLIEYLNQTYGTPTPTARNENPSQ